ncbi:cytochrome P450 [Pseudoduganella chitinolytica]|uniref:Cytochrome P450 n=1 Tax=Pseudoduganella chitinolytica TaxID=34070 RepID=A0ABY8BGM6_9BURK|nr:cytochrome P450 [Pseudoduganella chitinolytica]WEF35070.1 cytochrome P450 [Pseudoduganella chitinolytica]
MPSSHRTIATLPGPRGLPLLGSALQLHPRTIHRTMEAWSHRYGPMFRVRLGSREAVVLADAEAIGAVLRDRPDGFSRPVVTADVTRELGGLPGLTLAEGDDWRRQRRMAMQAFAPGFVKAYLPRLAQVGVRLAARWQGAAAAGQPVALSADLKRYAVDVVAGLAFGADIDTVNAGTHDLQDHIDTVLAGVARRSLAPLPYWRWLPLPAERRLVASVAALQAAIDGFVASGRAAMAADPALRSHPANLLQALIAAADEPGSGLGDAEVAGNVATMLMAGEDTTASALSWLAWLLAHHPDALRRARDEVRATVPDLALITPAQADALDYVEACALEAMRLKPPAPFIPLQALRPTVVRGVALPAGTLLWCVLRHASVDEALLANAAQFRPERWLPGGDATTPAARQAVLPFGAGARTCPGRYLALLEMKVALVALLGQFELDSVTAAGGADPAEVLGFVMAPTPLRMTLRPRAAGPGAGRLNAA